MKWARAVIAAPKAAAVCGLVNISTSIPNFVLIAPLREPSKAPPPVITTLRLVFLNSGNKRLRLLANAAKTPREILPNAASSSLVPT